MPELANLVKTLLDRGESVEKVAEKLKIDLTLASSFEISMHSPLT
jgi:hypothetical protein